jgi:hypothetical protein
MGHASAVLPDLDATFLDFAIDGVSYVAAADRVKRRPYTEYHCEV